MGLVACSPAGAYKRADRKPATKLCAGLEADREGHFAYALREVGEDCDVTRLAMEAACQVGDAGGQGAGAGCLAASRIWARRAKMVGSSTWNRATYWAKRACQAGGEQAGTEQRERACQWHAYLLGREDVLRARCEPQGDEKADERADGRACRLLARVVRGGEATFDFAAKGCELGDGVACRYAGQYRRRLEEKGAVPEGAKPALQYFAMGCEAGEPSACERTVVGKNDTEEARRRFWDSELDVTHRQVVEAGERACEAGFEHACSLLVDRWMREVSGEAPVREGAGASTPSEMRELARRGCEGGAAASCRLLGELRATWRYGVEQDLETAREAYRRACNLGSKMGCEGARTTSEHLAASETWRERVERCREAGVSEACGRATRAYAKGEVVERDVELAGELGERGCRAGDGASCRWAVEGGVGGGGETSESLSSRELILLREGCRLGDGASCERLGRYARSMKAGAGRLGTVAGAYKTAFEWFRRGCELGAPASCDEAAGLVIFLSGGDTPGHRKLVDFEEPEALTYRLARKGCELGHPGACLTYGIYSQSGSQKNPEAIRPALRKACEGGEAVACNNLGMFLVRGVGGPSDEEAGRVLMARACRMGHANACGAMVGLAEGAPEEVRMWMRMACRGGIGPACEEYVKEHEPGRDFLVSACREGSGPACLMLGEQLAASKDEWLRQRALKILEVGCSSGSSRACTETMNRKSNGDGSIPQIFRRR